MEEEKDVIVEKKVKKKHRFLKGLIIFIIILGIIVLTLGFVFPGLLWTKNLGIKYTKADYNSMMKKLALIKDVSPITGSKDDYEYTYGDLVEIKEEFTSEELTAFFNENRPSYYAIKNLQVRVNKNGTLEATGNVNVDYVLDELLDGKYTRADISENLPTLGWLPNNVNLYIKVGGSVTNNTSNVNVSSLSVQGITIPDNMITSSETKSTLTNSVNDSLAKHKGKTGTTFEKIEMENGKISLAGKIPSTINRIKK